MGNQNKYLVFGAPIIQEDEIAEVVQSLRSGWIGTGPKVKRFEDNFKKYKGASYAVALSSCTAALHLSLIAVGIQSGDEVITSAMTFCATINAIIHSGGTPVLADCSPITQCIDPDDIERKITPRTKAIIPVHFAGHACEMDEIMSLAHKYNLKVIEDCAHAIETTYKGIPVGNFGDFGCFSFYVTKNIITGEGGMVLTKDEENVDKIKMLALHGMDKDAWHRFSDEGYKHYDVVCSGFKYNMTDLQAAIGIHQLKKVDIYREKRKAIWDRYQSEFLKLGIHCPSKPPKFIKHAYHLYTVCIDSLNPSVSRDEFLVQMGGNGIGVGVHYRSIPTHIYYQKTYGWKPEDYPHSHKIGEQTVSLPLSPKLSDVDVERIISTVKDIL